MFGWDWDWDMNGDRDAFWRIVALLFALAGLADEAGGLSFFRRRELLGILCRGESAVRPYFAGMALGPLSEEDAFDDDEPEPCRDASLLAARFWAVAFMLAALLTLADPFAPPRDNSLAMAKAESRHGGQRPRPLHHASRGPPPP